MHKGDEGPLPVPEAAYETEDEQAHDEWIQKMQASPGVYGAFKDGSEGGIYDEEEEAAKDAEVNPSDAVAHEPQPEEDPAEHGDGDEDVHGDGDEDDHGDGDEDDHGDGDEDDHGDGDEDDHGGGDDHGDGDGQADAAQKSLYSDEFHEDEKDRDDLKKFVEGERNKTVDDQGWKQQYRNKGYYNGHRGNNKYHGKGHGWYGKGWQKGQKVQKGHKGKSKGKSKGYRWPKWNQDWSYNREEWGKHQWWDADEGQASSSTCDAGVVLQQCKKGGYYLPKQQGYIDPEGNFHPQLSFDQSFSNGGRIKTLVQVFLNKRYIPFVCSKCASNKGKKHKGKKINKYGTSF